MMANLKFACIGFGTDTILTKGGDPNSVYCVNENMTLKEVRKRYSMAKNMPYGDNVIYGLYRQVCK